jgi:RNA polymerase sigma factor (sigma-70 family)
MNAPSLHTIQLQGWIRRLNEGDPKAADELFGAASERLERLARRMLRNFPNVRRLADTADVCQEAALRLLRTLHQIQPSPATVRDFLSLAATHIRRELLDLARRCGAAKRRGEVAWTEDDSFPEAVAAEEDNHEELERWRTFHEVVERLPAEEREVVSLRFYHGWSEAQIAELFEVTERTVRRRWAAGCARLTEALPDGLPRA